MDQTEGQERAEKRKTSEIPPERRKMPRDAKKKDGRKKKAKAKGVRMTTPLKDRREPKKEDASEKHLKKKEANR